MRIINKFIKLLSIFHALSLLNGCVPAVVSGAAGAGAALYQDKTVGEELSDQTIWAKIRAALMKENIDSPMGDINIKVNEGRVLLTGTVKNREVMVQVVRICWERDGVKEVINELKLANQVKGGLKQYAHDTWITTRLKSKLFFNKHVKSVNFNIITINGVVYIIGIAQDQDELNLVTDAASQISGVKEVISYIRVKKNPEKANIETAVTTNSIEEFNDQDLKFEDSKPISKPTPAKESPSTKNDEIFSEEDLNSF